MRAGRIDAERVDGEEVVSQIGAKAVGGDEGAVAACPVGVQEVGVGVGPEIVMPAVELSYDGLEGRVAVEAPRKEKGAGDLVFAERGCDGRQAVAEFVAAEYQGYGFAGRVASDDGAVGKGKMGRVGQEQGSPVGLSGHVRLSGPVGLSGHMALSGGRVPAEAVGEQCAEQRGKDRSFHGRVE